jgi:protein-L-isoaspartate O-methyltransferase
MAVGERIRLERMVKKLAEQGIKNENVLRAMKSIPRERFVEETPRCRSARDRPSPNPGSSPA